MKLFLLPFLLLAGLGATAQKDVLFKQTAFQFGKIKKDKPASHVFNFTNQSTKPIVVEYANAECGCTKPEYTIVPIAKGKSASIKVTYNAASVGIFKKKVDVKFAHSNQPYTLTIEGEVVDETKKK